MSAINLGNPPAHCKRGGRVAVNEVGLAMALNIHRPKKSKPIKLSLEGAVRRAKSEGAVNVGDVCAWIAKNAPNINYKHLKTKQIKELMEEVDRKQRIIKQLER